MSRYRMSLDSGWESNAFEPFKEVEFKTADGKTIIYSKIVHGEWIDTDPSQPLDPRVTCSICGNTEVLFKGNFCPNCGADMKGGTDNGNSI